MTSVLGPVRFMIPDSVSIVGFETTVAGCLTSKTALLGMLSFSWAGEYSKLDCGDFGKSSWCPVLRPLNSSYCVNVEHGTSCLVATELQSRVVTISQIYR